MSARLIAYAVASGALLFVGLQWHERGKEIARLNQSAGTLTAERDQCLADQKANDEALAVIRAAGEADRLRREAAERRAAKARVDAEERVAKALMARVPTECPAAMQWLGDYGRALANTWGAQ